VPLASQVIISQTIGNNKNLRSIVNKIIGQIVAKMGGVPWAIDKMPLMKEPTMICGYDVFHKKRAQSILAFNATVDQEGTR
jgi:aubergine